MNNWTRTFSVILMVGGGLIIAVAIVADWIGLDSAGIGIKQVLLGLAGIVTLLAGLGILKSPKVRLLLGRYAKQLVIATGVVVLICGLVVTVLGVFRIVDLTTRNEALPLLKEIISMEYPEMRNGQLNDWEKVNLLRQWAYEHVDWGSLSTQMNQEQYQRFFDAAAPTEFAMFLKDEGAVMCQGTAFALMKLYEAYGYDAYHLGVELPGVMSHAMTLVSIDYDGEDILTVQDAWFDIAYVDPDGEPYDYLDLLAVVNNGNHELVEIEEGACKPRDYLFCTDEEFTSQSWSNLADSPVPALSEGRMKVKFGPTVSDWWDSDGTVISDYLVQDGYPPHLCYMFLYLLYIRDGNGDVRELMDRATSILG